MSNYEVWKIYTINIVGNALCYQENLSQDTKGCDTLYTQWYSFNVTGFASVVCALQCIGLDTGFNRLSP